MGNKEQYLKYKPVFKKNAVMKAVMNAVMFLTLILLFFLPCFRIQPKGAELGSLLGIDLGINFSLYDEVALVFSPHESGGPNIAVMIFQIFAIIFFAGGIVATAVDLVKSAMNCINSENYAILEYDKIKSRAEKQRMFRQSSPTTMFFTAIIYEVFAIILSKFLNRSVGETEAITDYFSSMNTVAWGFWIILIFVLADIALAVLTALMRNKVKVQILKEDYEKNEGPENGEKHEDSAGSEFGGSEYGEKHEYREKHDFGDFE